MYPTNCPIRSLYFLCNKYELEIRQHVKSSAKDPDATVSIPLAVKKLSTPELREHVQKYLIVYECDPESNFLNWNFRSMLS
jgi:hypothetical protein